MAVCLGPPARAAGQQGSCSRRCRQMTSGLTEMPIEESLPHSLVRQGQCKNNVPLIKVSARKVHFQPDMDRGVRARAPVQAGRSNSFLRTPSVPSGQR